MTEALSGVRRRRGAVLPSAVAIQAPAILGPRGKAHWDVVWQSRPGFYSAVDVPLLTSYCAAVAEMEAIIHGEAPADGLEKAESRVIRLGRVLRLTPIARADNEEAASTPDFERNAAAAVMEPRAPNSSFAWMRSAA